MAADHVQTNTGAATSTSSTLTASYTQHNGVVISLLFNDNATNVGTITQTAGDTATVTSALMDSGGTYVIQYYVADISATGSMTFTFSHNSVPWRIFITEISGQATSSLFDTWAGTTASFATTHSSGTTATLAQADEIAIAVFHADGSGTTNFTSATNGFTVPSNGNQLGSSVTVPRALLLTKVTTSTSAVETTVTTDSMTSTGLVGTYKAAAVGGSPTITWVGYIG